MPPRASLPTPAAVATRLHSAAIHLLRCLRRGDPAAGLPPAALSALSVLIARGPLSLGALARFEQVRPATMSRLIRALEARKLVTRQVDPTDRRAVRLRPTARGRAVFERARDARLAVLAERLAHLDPEQVALLNRAATVMEQVAGAGGRAARR